MRAPLHLAVLALAAAALLAGSGGRAGAVPSGGERAQHCLTATSNLITFVASGSGTVTPPSGARPCGTVVAITATPAEHFRFTGWVGHCSGTANPCNLFLAHGANELTYSVGANFERIRQTVTVQRTGNGAVTSDPPGINCGTTCSAQFAQGGQVALDAIADPGIEFQGWGGACSNAVRNRRCVLTVPASAVTVTATFGPPPVQLTVTKSGNGTVTSSPAGINCGGTCSAAFPSGSQVTLTATPAPEYPFQGWGGACSGTATTCRLTLTAATSVSARFSSGKVDGLASGFRGTWRRSRYSGALVVRGTATAALELTARIASDSPAALRSPQSRAIEETFRFSVPAGPFERSFPLPATGFYPGRYALSLTGTSGGLPIIGRAAVVRMEPPPEGIVVRAWVTAGGRTVTRVPRATRLVAHFVYATKPFRGAIVTVSWFHRSRLLGTVRRIRWKPTVTTFVQSPRGLARGRYACVLKASGRVVYEVSVRVG